MDRSARRELVFGLIYSMIIQKELKEDGINLFLENSDVIEEEDKKYITQITLGIQEKKEEIGSQIAKNLKKDWDIGRISKIDLALLQLAIYEITIMEVPFKVVINEVVELAKKYGEDSSASFINGVLANIVNKD